MLKNALVIAFGLLTGAFVAWGVEPDLSTPQGARRAYDAALYVGDAPAAKAAAVYNADWEKVIESGAAADAGMAKLRKAAADRWGNAAKGAFPERKLDDIAGTEYQVMG